MPKTPPPTNPAEVLDKVVHEPVPRWESEIATIVDTQEEVWPPKLLTRFKGRQLPRRVLADNALIYIGGLNWGINEAHKQYMRLEKDKPAVAMRYLETAVRAQIRALTLTIGTTLRVEQAQGQEGVPRWEAYPAEVREAFAKFLDAAGAAGIDVAGLMGATPVARAPVPAGP